MAMERGVGGGIFVLFFCFLTREGGYFIRFKIRGKSFRVLVWCVLAWGEKMEREVGRREGKGKVREEVVYSFIVLRDGDQVAMLPGRIYHSVLLVVHKFAI